MTPDAERGARATRHAEPVEACVAGGERGASSRLRAARAVMLRRAQHDVCFDGLSMAAVIPLIASLSHPSQLAVVRVAPPNGVGESKGQHTS
jgi:hypothetical protein